MDRNIKLQLSVLASIVILALSSCGGGTTTSQSTSEPSDGVVRVIADDTQKFDQERYTASPGVVEIEYILDGFQAHNLLIEGYEEDLVLEVENGETANGSISLEPGRYILYCDIAGHREAGMEAQLLVE
ncbi:MAG: hypothetical protein CL512_04345 [Actinobacteria bacterium]|nr:hypothetical protein [Actinomycetota bacterium]|tara:strand:- start:2593 stop:2979 length:387 start_codon:yes stop_codon:yes gene_type:complete